ncbi:MAG: DUF1570 domain-containing protein [Planctomycetota bacterium]
MSMKRKWLVTAGMAFLLLGVGAAVADQIQGRYRIELMNGRYVEGDVKELPDGSYEVKTRHGVTVTVKRSEVRGLRALEAVRPAESPTAAPRNPGATLRREISDAEIEAIVAGIEANPDEAMVGVARDDMMAPLPLDTESVLEMMRQAGVPRKEGVPFEDDKHDGVLVKDHFVMVYTSSKDAARALASRLEAVYRWNVKMLSMLQIPARRPEHKLEIYYFASWDEFDRYSRNKGSPLPPGVLGYYSPDINRSHFFDMRTMPGLKEHLEALKRPGTPWREKQRLTNLINRYVEHQNVETIQHETGHHIHFNIGLFPKDGLSREASVPIWLVEGTTMLFEVPPSKAGASLGVLNNNRLFYLRHLFGERPLDPQRWKLFLIDNHYWYGGGWGVAESYQLGWAMVYYLWKEHRAGYAKYLQKVFGREEALSMTEREAELVECFGPLNDEWFEKFYNFLARLELRPSLVDPFTEDAAKAQNAGRRAQRQGGGGGEESSGRSGGRGRTR